LNILRRDLNTSCITTNRGVWRHSRGPIICALSIGDLWLRFQGHGITECEYLKNGAC